MKDKTKIDNGAVLTEEERRKMRRNALIKMGAMGLFVLIVLIFSSIAWLTMNREVENSGMKMTASDMPFEIATHGSGVRNQSVINALRPEYGEGIPNPLINNNNISGTYYQNDCLLLRYDTGASIIGPGGSGELSFFVVPKSNEATPVTISLNVVAFAKIEKKDANGNPIYKMNANNQYVLDDNNNKIVDTVIVEITNATEFAAAANEVNNSIVADKAADYVKASEFLTGHIMFFGEEAASGANYYYNAAYPTREISTTIAAGNKDKAVPVPINWMWTNTLGQIVMKKQSTNPNTQRNGKPVVQDLTNEQFTLTTTEKAKVIKYVKDNKDDVLANWTDILTAEELLHTFPSETNPEPQTISQVVDGLIEDIDNEENFDRLSACYNAADYAIGTKIAYFMIEVSVKSGTE